MEQQNELANVVTAARMLHSLRALTAEVETLLAQAMVRADATGITKTVIAEAAGLTRGRVSQIVTATPSAPNPHDRLYKITEWPGDAIREHAADFAGTMTYPPYTRRRTTTNN